MRIYWTALTLSHAITDQWKVRGRFFSQIGDGFYEDMIGLGLDESTGIMDRFFFHGDFETEVYFPTGKGDRFIYRGAFWNNNDR